MYIKKTAETIHTPLVWETKFLRKEIFKHYAMDYIKDCNLNFDQA